jgi:hypothetical protein
LRCTGQTHFTRQTIADFLLGVFFRFHVQDSGGQQRRFGNALPPGQQPLPNDFDSHFFIAHLFVLVVVIDFTKFIQQSTLGQTYLVKPHTSIV